MSQQSAGWRMNLKQDWPNRAAMLLSGILLLQFVLWFKQEEGWWHEETALIVQLTLLATLLIENVPRLPSLVRGLLELAAILVINVQVLSRSPAIPEPISLQTFFSPRFAEGLYALTPYIWFALGAWVVYLTVIWWVEVKWRVYALLLLSVIVLCIRDSFSSIYLWPHVAVVITCGLFLIILCHFQQLRRKDPRAWSYLSDYPSKIVVPVVLLVTLTVAAGAVMPEVRPTLTDPYTAWLSSRGEPPAFTTGKGIVLSNERNPGSASSGYSRNDSELGGGFDFDYSAIMTVNTTHRSYWRGEALSIYSGKGWEPSTLESTVGRSRMMIGMPADGDPFNENLETIEVRQTFTFFTAESFPVLFGAYEISQMEGISFADSEGNPVSTNHRGYFSGALWSPHQSELFYSSRRPYPKSYTVVSHVPVIDEDRLRQAPEYGSVTSGRTKTLTNDRNESMQVNNDIYLQLPPGLPDRVRRLAEEITAEAGNPYDKAKKLEQYLRTTYTYTSKPDESKGTSEDFVDRFLFEIQEGYCDYFSTAMAVMARSVGLPTRWVKGYATGRHALSDEIGFGERLEDYLDEWGSGTYTVRNADAHSWVEVYFTGYGWIPFEPTAGFTLPVSSNTEAAEPDIPAATTPEGAEAAEGEAGNDSGSLALLWAGIAAAVLLAAGLAGWKLQWWELLTEQLRRRKASQHRHKILLECERLLRLFRRKGYVREEHETLREAARRWSEDRSAMKADLDAVLLLFEKAKYGNREITEQDLGTAVSLVDKLRAQL